MDKQRKSVELEFLKEVFENSSVVYLVDYKGLGVEQMTDLRAQLRAAGAIAKVVKNTLAKIALVGTSFEGLAGFCQGPVAIVYAKDEPVIPAKVLVKYAQENESLTVKGAVLDGKVLDDSEVKALSKLPSREEMLAKLLGSMQSPAQGLAGVLTAIPRQLHTVLSAVRDQKE